MAGLGVDPGKITRRAALGGLAVAGGTAVNAIAIEPNWLATAGDRVLILAASSRQANELVKVGALADGADLADVNYTNLVKLIIAKAEELYWKWRVRPVLSTRKKCTALSAKEIRAVVRRHFSHDVNSAETEAYQEYEAFVDGVLQKTLADLSRPERSAQL